MLQNIKAFQKKMIFDFHIDLNKLLETWLSYCHSIFAIEFKG